MERKVEEEVPAETAEAEETVEVTAQFDHSTVIKGPFETARDLTAACLNCHSSQAEDFMKTVHWTWQGDASNMVGWDGVEEVGKMTTINNFCIAVESNEARCTQCHAGYGWKDENFDFSAASNIDCLVCHDGTGTYKKDKKTAGLPVEGIDLLAVAQSVGSPTRQNCGACHFFAGGGDNVKKGDLGSALINPEPSTDVHMGMLDFTCQTCHVTENHDIPGASLHVTISSGNVSCLDCHAETPHEDDNLNNHTDSVACQTCHIPDFSSTQATKMYWDWSTAGKKDTDGKPFSTKDENGNLSYNTLKGNFVYKQNVRPEYAWWNGKVNRMLIDDTYDSIPVDLASPVGDISDPDSKIYPFKVMRGIQGVDPVNKTILVPHLFGKIGGDNPYWGTWNWEKAFEEGMAYADLPYSGTYEWADTTMHLAIQHEVAPGSDALGCMDCHSGGIDFKALGYSDDPMTVGGR